MGCLYFPFLQLESIQNHSPGLRSVQESYSHIFQQRSEPVYEWYDTLDSERGLITSSGARFTKYLKKNPKFIVGFSQVYLKFILSYKVKIFTDFYMSFTKAIL